MIWSDGAITVGCPRSKVKVRLCDFVRATVGILDDGASRIYQGLLEVETQETPVDKLRTDFRSRTGILREWQIQLAAQTGVIHWICVELELVGVGISKTALGARMKRFYSF